MLVPVAGTGQTFQNSSDVSGTWNNAFLSTGAAWGDYDSDGDLDLYVTNWGAGISSEVAINALYENRDGSFVDVAAERGVDNGGNSSAAAWGDYDNDGDLDLYVTDFFPDAQDNLYENRDGSFVEVGREIAGVNLIKQGAVTSVAWGDYDNDGWLDFYLGKFYFNNELYQNRGDGTFLPIVDLGVGDKRDTQGVNWVDYDSDGDLDLYTVNREQENALYQNESGLFTERAGDLGLDDKEIGQSAAWVDYDNDGDLDLYLANAGGNRLYRSDAAKDFTDVGKEAGVRHAGAGWISAMAAWADYDGDGDLDLYLANGGDRLEQPDALLANNGDGTFRDATTDALLPTGKTAHMAAVWGDFDGNGSPDLYVTEGLGFLRVNNPRPWNYLFKNDTPGSLFIKVTVQGLGLQSGSRSRDAIGTQVRLVDATTGDLRGYRQVLPGDNATGLIFGAPSGPYDVEVRFPGDTNFAVARRGVSGGQVVTIVEPE